VTRLLLAAVAALAAATTAACATAAPPAPTGPSALVRADIDRAETAEKARRHDLARQHYQQAVADAHDPASQRFARREFAETLETWGELAEATAQLEGAVAARPDDAASWHDLGFLRFEQGDTAGALVALERSKTLAPRDPRPRKTLAVIRWRSHDYAGAEAEYRGMLGLDLPAGVRSKVEWAIGELEKLQHP
jgi:Tfp pilus assembly protein PilF